MKALSRKPLCFSRSFPKYGSGLWKAKDTRPFWRSVTAEGQWQPQVLDLGTLFRHRTRTFSPLGEPFWTPL